MFSIRLLSIFLLSLFLLPFYSSAAYAVTDRCPRHDLKTSMKNRMAKTRVFKGTTKGFTSYVHGHSRTGSRTLGFVQYRGLTTTFDTKFEVVGIGSGKYCVKMTNVRGYFNMNPKLFMPTDYKKKSCEYQQILKHEKRHLAELRGYHNKYSKKFEAHLGRVARSLPIPKPVSTQAEINKVANDLERHFITEFKGFEYKAWTQLRNAQSTIDSPQEYRGVAKRCDNW